MEYEQVKVGDVVRLTKNTNAGLQGCVVVAFEKSSSVYPPGATVESLTRPRHVYLEITQIKGETLTGRDLQRGLRKRSYERQIIYGEPSHEFKERTPDETGKATRDLWGWSGLVRASPDEVVALIKEARQKLREERAGVARQARVYTASTQSLLRRSRKAANARKRKSA